MFTGIVEEKGRIERLDITGSSGSVKIKASKVLEGTRVGDSIAVNGICLTVTALSERGFTADVMGETVRRSSLREMEPGSAVNLERAMPADGRFGGHLVSGHIDGTGRIVSMTREENAVWVRISADDRIMRYVVEKGSVCIDGISLTVARVSSGYFEVSVIPHTLSETVLGDRSPGSNVNIENDIIGKYVERLMTFKGEDRQGSRLTMEMLEEYGF